MDAALPHKTRLTCSTASQVSNGYNQKNVLFLHPESHVCFKGSGTFVRNQKRFLIVCQIAANHGAYPALSCLHCVIVQREREYTTAWCIVEQKETAICLIAAHIDAPHAPCLCTSRTGRAISLPSRPHSTS